MRFSRLLHLARRMLTSHVDDSDRGPETEDRASPDVVAVAGERGISALDRTQSAQSRVTSMLAIGLMSILALGFLAWYYTQSFASRAEAQQGAKAESRARAKGEMSLPPLGRIDPPTVERVLGPMPPLPDDTLSPSVESHDYRTASPRELGRGHSGRQSSVQTDLERRLSGPVFLAASSRPTSPSTHIYESDNTPGPQPVPVVATGSPASDLARLLDPSATPAAQAKVLPTQRLLLPKGSALDCTLETAIDSTLPGMTTCVTAIDTFSSDGSVVLLERGTKLVGETRGQVRQGSTRVFVLWTEARTPAGVVVPLASPGTDELGRSGLPGEVDRHFRERFGAAILLSVIDGAVQATAQRSGDGGTVLYSPSTSSDVLTEVLRSTISIPPSVAKQNGDRIAVLVARDLDFRSVYELHHSAERP